MDYNEAIEDSIDSLEDYERHHYEEMYGKNYCEVMPLSHILTHPSYRQIKESNSIAGRIDRKEAMKAAGWL